MKIQFLVGKKNSGKTQYANQQIAEKMNLDSQIIMVVPEQYTVQAEAEFLMRTEKNGIVGFDIMSFKRLSHKILAEYKKEPYVICDNTTHLLLLKKIILELSPQLAYYGRVSKFDGFLEEVDVSIKLFQASGVSLAMLEGFLSQVKEEKFYRKLQDFYLIYKQYVAATMEGKRVFHNALVLAMESEECMEFFKNKEIWVDYFDGFTYLEMLFMAQIAQYAEAFHLVFDIPCEEDSRYEYDKEEYQEIEKLFEKMGLEKEIIHFNGNIARDQEVSFVSNNFMKQKKTSYKKMPQHFYLNVERNPTEEVFKMASHIKYLVRTQNYRWKDFCVLCTDMKEYQDPIHRVFGIYGIPFFYDHKRTIKNHPLIHLVLTALRVLKTNQKREQVLEFLKNPYFKIPFSQKEQFATYCNQYGISFGKFQWEMKGEEVEETRKLLMEKIQVIKEEVESKIKIGELENAILSLFAIFQVESVTEEFIELLEERKEQEIASLYQQIPELLLYLARQTEALMGELEWTVDGVLSILESLLKNMELGIIPPTLDHVFVGDHDRSKVKNAKVVFSIGLNDGKIPIIPSQKALFDEQEMDILKQLGMPFFAESKLEILLSLSKFTKYLELAKEMHIFSMASQNTRGQALRPSIYVEQMKEILPQMKEYNLTEKEDFYLDEEDTMKYLTVRNFREQKDSNFPRAMMISWAKEKDPQFYQELFYYQDYVNEVTKERNNIQKLFTEQKSFSISQIEQYYRCNYAYFLKYGLRLKEVPGYHFQAIDYGNMMHKILEVFSSQVEQKGYLWGELKEERIKEILYEQVFPKVFTEAQQKYFEENSRQNFGYEKLKTISLEACMLLVKQICIGKFVPMYFEKSFGDSFQNGEVPIEMKDTEGNPYYLRGKIDRIDVYKDREEVFVRVIDYKSSANRIDFAKMENGIQMQLIFYLDITSKEIKKGAKPAGALYFEMKDPFVEWEEGKSVEELRLEQVKLEGILLEDMEAIHAMDETLQEKKQSVVVGVSLTKDGSPRKSPYILKGEDMEIWFEHVEEMISHGVSQIKKGEISINPYQYKGEKGCTYCDYKSICQFDSAFLNKTHLIERSLGMSSQREE